MSEPDDGPVVGLTGARFGGERRRKRRPGGSAPVDLAVDGPAAPPVNPAVGRTGARFGRALPEPEPEAQEPTTPVVPMPALVIEPPELPELSELSELSEEDVLGVGDRLRVRPYVLTGGRTRASRELPIETLVSSGLPGGPPATVEQRQVVDMCARPRSIAEVAALLGVPLGVARVLVADLADCGAITVHAAVATDLDLMRRVLAGLHRL
ncbi:DUF742 domain-containing protein [Pseudonocardia sp. CA-107938]|uniref:DUF742 domain-containing protein n=1 Tax=Pseudonocardia sp. CA-107938 TaxID=3240021 RepID=UPI003D8AAD9B